MAGVGDVRPNFSARLIKLKTLGMRFELDLTDFLVRHFEHLVIGSLGLDRHPELAPLYFGNYRRVVYLAQAPSETSLAAAQSIAVRMGLEFKLQFTGYGGLAAGLQRFVQAEDSGAWQA